MHTVVKKSLLSTSESEEAERILRSCVHCGFCTATCPTYQLLGDELDGPRGRIYLIKSMLEGEAATDKTMLHLDRCLTCRACETTCPSGVEYGKLLDIGRQVVEEEVDRVWYQRLQRYLILKMLPYRGRFGLLLGFAQLFRFILPPKLKQLVPAYKKQLPAPVRGNHDRKVLLFKGCVQSVIAPGINGAAVKVLDHLGVTVDEIENQTCCGALPQHLSAAEQAKVLMRKNIDAFWPFVEQDAEAIISTASGCGVHLKEYGYLLQDDHEYAQKAEKISALCKDIAEYVIELELNNIPKDHAKKLAFQSPCTLQHGQKLNGVTESLLNQLGFKLTEVKDPHLCCGSAGVYSILQQNISGKLQKNKIENLMQGEPEMILTANIGCAQHLRQVSSVPVKHWIEEVATLID